MGNYEWVEPTVDAGLEEYAARNRAEAYIEEGRISEMIPWSELLPSERETALKFWGAGWDGR